MSEAQTVSAQVQILPGLTNLFGYLLYLPPGYNTRQDHRWPLMLFLHGAGERGSNLAWLTRNGPPKLVEQGRIFPFIMVSPQCPPGRYWESGPLIKLLDDIEKTWAVDSDRIFITGMSMGGYGAWITMAAQPGRFAAAALVCAGGNPMDAHKLAHLPIWLFHGDKDDVVPVSESLAIANALKAAAGNVRVTIYPGVDHDSWTQTYENPELYEWFLAQRRQ